MAQHNFQIGKTGDDVYKSISKINTRGNILEGKIHHGEVITNPPLGKFHGMTSDSVFVEFNSGRECLSEREIGNRIYCIRYGQNQYNKTVAPYTIYKSPGQTYNVTGVHEIERRFEFVKYMGITSGEQTIRAISGNYTHPEMRVYHDRNIVHLVDTVLPHDPSNLR